MKSLIKKVILLLFFIMQLCVNSRSPVIISGLVTDENNQPLPYVNVFITETFDGAMTSKEGKFQFSTSKEGEVEIVASLVGYKKFIAVFSVDELNDNPLKIILYPEAVQTSEVIVTASSFGSEQEKGVTVTAMDVMTTPGGAADIFQSLKTMPGITQVSESAELYVRGGDPYETITLFDQASLNHPYTFESAYGGIFSNINTNSIDNLFFSSGGFSAKYGNALSGVLSLESKDRPDNRQLSLGLSLASADINGEFPINNEIGIRFNGRQSFTAPIFWLNGGVDDFTVVPVSRDANASLSYKFSESGRIKIFGYAASDEQGVNVDLPGYTDQFEGTSGSNFINLQLKEILFGNVILKSSLSRSFYSNTWQLGILNIEREDAVIKSRTDLEYVINTKTKILSGFEIEKRDAYYKGVIPAEDYDLRENGNGEMINARFGMTRIGGYSELEKSDLFGINNFFAVAGLRTDYIEKLGLVWFDPRLNAGYKITSKSTLSIGWGIFHQHPDPRLYSQKDGNPELNSMRADHYIISFDYKIGKNENFRAEVYYKDYTALPLEDNLTNYNNNGYGFAKGMDILFKGNLTNDLTGWISYGLIETKRKWLDINRFVSSNFDITHNISIVAKYTLSPELQLGLNYKYATGKPYTPVDNSLYKDALGIYEPIYGDKNSERFPDYQRLDLRLTYLTHLFDKWFSVFYIEGLNILDIKNIFDYSYNLDYSRKKKVESYFGRRTIVFGGIIYL